MKQKAILKLNFDFEILGKEISKYLSNYLVKVGIEIRNGILKRTQSGYDVRNFRFRPYKRKYKEFKRDSGRSVSIVNLTFRSHMLLDMKVKKTTKGSTIYFESADERIKALKNNFGIGVRKREFFGIRREQEEKALLMMDTAIIEVIR